MLQPGPVEHSVFCSRYWIGYCSPENAIGIFGLGMGTLTWRENQEQKLVKAYETPRGWQESFLKMSANVNEEVAVEERGLRGDSSPIGRAILVKNLRWFDDYLA